MTMGSDILKDKIKSVVTIALCLIYKKAPPRPTVGLPVANKLKEWVAMDLKF